MPNFKEPMAPQNEVVTAILETNLGPIPIKVWPEDARSLNLTGQLQTESNWCWAATTVAIALYYDSFCGWTQCSLVNKAFGLTTCCDDPKSDECNRSGSARQGLEITGLLGATYSTKPSIGAIVEEIDGGRPMSVNIYWQDDGGGHDIAITAYANILSDSPKIGVHDPEIGFSYVDYDVFPANYRKGASFGNIHFTRRGAG